MHEDLPPLGSTVGPWRILDLLDSSSYGVVFRAQHTARPPEQRAFVYATRKSFDARWVSRPPDDLYSLGVTLYRLVTGTYLPPCTDGIGPVKREVPKPSELATVSPSLETLILQLISDDTGARGTAEHLGDEATRLAQAAGPEAQLPILPLLSEAPSAQGCTSSGTPSRQEALSDTDPAPARHECWRTHFSPGCLRLLAMGGAAVALMLLVVWPVPERPQAPWLATPEQAPQFAPDAGVAEEVSSVQDVPQTALPTLLSLSRPMPKNPLRGQRKPPCERGETTINGACWVWVGGETPPCGDTMFDYDGRCFKASTDAPRQPTSEQP